jgi:hypothetical protein
MTDCQPYAVPDAQPTPLAETDLLWSRLYRLGGFAGALFVILTLIPVVLVFTAPIPPTEGWALLAYIEGHQGVYLTQLVCFVALAVPALIVFAATAVALTGVDKSLAAVGGLIGVVSETIALSLGSSPQSLHGGLVVLSNTYANTPSDAQRATLSGAADALIAATNAVSWAGILTAAAILVLSSLMRRSSFGRALAIFGMITGALGLVSELFRPVIGPAYLLYGLLLPAWFALVGRSLWRLGRESS